MKRSSRKKKKRRRRSTSSSSSNSESSTERRRRQRRRSREKVTKRRKEDEVREDGELSEDDDYSDDEPLIREKHKTNRQPMGKERFGKYETIEIIDSSHSSTDSEFGFSNGQMQGEFQSAMRTFYFALPFTFVIDLAIDSIYSHSLTSSSQMSRRNIRLPFELLCKRPKSRN